MNNDAIKIRLFLLNYEDYTILIAGEKKACVIRNHNLSYMEADGGRGPGDLLLRKSPNVRLDLRKSIGIFEISFMCLWPLLVTFLAEFRVTEENRSNEY